ncbi:MAG TPA: recombinase RecT [Burkholderiaceae bacterium]|nr:recombinase RecT [Burkholderiaceae bacterium]
MAASNVVALIRSDLANPAFRQQLQAALPEHVNLDKFVRTVITAIQSNYMLAQADRTTLLKACMESAADGLLPDGREGAIVPFRNGRTGKTEAQWQPMVWGLVKLVRNSGELKDIGVEIVRSADHFERWIDENGPHFKHTPSLDGSGTPVGVYAYARTKDGGFYIEYMTWTEIEKFKALSKAKNGPWQDWPEEMAKVRPIKRLCKRLPMSTDAIEALRRDDDRETRHVADQIDPVAALNRQIAGEPAGAPALTNNPTPTFSELDAMLREATSIDALQEIANLVPAVENVADQDELRSMLEVRREELQQRADA